MEKVWDTIQNIWANQFVQALVWLVLAFVVAGLASWLVKKLCKALKLDAKLDKIGVNEGQVGTSVNFVGKLVYLVVFLLFLPASLNALGLDSVSAPISGLATTFLSYLPNIIFAIILTFVGIFLGQILGQIVAVLLAKTKIDNLTSKLGGKNEGFKLSLVIGKIVYAATVLIMIVQALTVLGIEAISAPALSIINSIFGAIPSIILAVVVVACGLLVANIACNLLGNVLVGVNFDGVIAKIIPQAGNKFSASKVVVNIVRTVIIFFVAAQGVEVLGLAMLTNIMTAIIAYLPLVIKALIIAIVAFFGANFLESFLNKNVPNVKNIGKIAKAMVFVVAAFMILSQLDFATVIVNAAFIIIMIALGAAFALAFGLGGKDFAKKTLDKVEIKAENADKEEKKADASDNENA